MHTEMCEWPSHIFTRLFMEYLHSGANFMGTGDGGRGSRPNPITDKKHNVRIF